MTKFINTGLPNDASGILRDEWIGGEQRHTMHDGLADEQPVEWIAVKGREARGLQHRFLVDRQALDTVMFAHRWDESLGRLRERQPAERVFGGNFPSRSRA